MSRRTERVSELLRAEISTLIQRSVKDPRVEEGLISVTEVQVSPDLRRATVFISHFGDEYSHEEVIEALQHAAPFLHTELVHRLKMRSIPQLTFRLDPSLERGAHLTSLIAETMRETEPRD
jgi:ribosome-binding factor A